LILERVDAQTLAMARQMQLGAPFDLVIVPNRRPRSKPKALNYALAFARGDYVGVYDAEDLPDPGQLKKVVAKFAAGPVNLGCVQCQLAIDNASSGWLCRQFALEYLTHFDGLLPALDRLGLPLPLGGTSNHFPVRVLRHVGAWDAWNVTEDADLGLRLSRYGYRCQMLASTTHEEAPHQFGNWLRQRSRWMKGFMQTYIVHNRRPLRLLRELGLWRWFGVQIQFGGGIVSCLLYPLSLVLLAIQAAMGWPSLYASAPGDRLLISLAIYNLAAGIGIALANSCVCAVSRRQWRLLAEIPFMPVYWLLISLATYRAVFQLAQQPFRWEKTDHGLSGARYFVRPGRVSPGRK
jgi:glycosyltransferase XagB